MADPNKVPLPKPPDYAKSAINGREKQIDDAVDEAVNGAPPDKQVSPPVPRQNQSSDHMNSY